MGRVSNMSIPSSQFAGVLPRGGYDKWHNASKQRRPWRRLSWLEGCAFPVSRFKHASSRHSDFSHSGLLARDHCSSDDEVISSFLFDYLRRVLFGIRAPASMFLMKIWVALPKVVRCWLLNFGCISEMVHRDKTYMYIGR